MNRINQVVQDYLKDVKVEDSKGLDISNFALGVEFTFTWIGRMNNLISYLANDCKLSIQELSICLACILEDSKNEVLIQELMKKYDKSSFILAVDLLAKGINMEIIQYLQKIEDKEKLVLAHFLFEKGLRISDFEEIINDADCIRIFTQPQEQDDKEIENIQAAIHIYIALKQNKNPSIEEKEIMEFIEKDIFDELELVEVAALITEFGVIPYLMKRLNELQMMN